MDWYNVFKDAVRRLRFLLQESKVSRMTNNQRRFADEYLKDCNATRAYKAAYPRIKNDDVASTAGGRMLRNVEVKKYIDEQLEKMHNEKTADAQEVIEYLTSVLRGDSEGCEIVVEGTGDGCSEAREVAKSPSEKDKLKAAELLGKRFGLFRDNLNVTGALPVVIEDDVEG